MIGPATLEYLIDFFTRHSSSVDGFTTVLQVSKLHSSWADPVLSFNLACPYETLRRSSGRLSSGA